MPYELLSGRLEGVVNFPRDREPMVRDWVNPTQPNTDLQVQIRHYFALASQSFNEITDQQRVKWHSYAQRIKRINSLGREYIIPDKSLFVQVNLYRQFYGSPITFDCPEYSPAGEISSVHLTLVKTPSHYECSITGHSSMLSGYVFFETSPALPGLQRKARKNELRMYDPYIAHNISWYNSNNIDHLMESSNFRYIYTALDRFCIQVTPLTTGFVAGKSYQFYQTGI